MNAFERTAARRCTTSEAVRLSLDKADRLDVRQRSVSAYAVMQSSLMPLTTSQTSSAARPRRFLGDLRSPRSRAESAAPVRLACARPRAAGRERHGRNLPSRKHERRVPRRDAADRTYRHPTCVMLIWPSAAQPSPSRASGARSAKKLQTLGAAQRGFRAMNFSAWPVLMHSIKSCPQWV